MNTTNTIDGFKVYIDKNGKQVSATEATADALASGEIREQINGPHHDAKWARRILGTDISNNQARRKRLCITL